MRNVTISLDDQTAKWVRVEAARRDTSVSRLVGRLLREFMTAEAGYDTAMADYMSRGARPLKKKGSVYPRREDVHARARLR